MLFLRAFAYISLHLTLIIMPLALDRMITGEKFSLFPLSWSFAVICLLPSYHLIVLGLASWWNYLVLGLALTLSFQGFQRPTADFLEYGLDPQIALALLFFEIPAVLLSTFLKTPFRKFVFQAAERSSSRGSDPNPIGLPWLFSVWGASFIIGILLFPHVNIDQLTNMREIDPIQLQVRLLLFVMAPALMLSAFLLHFRPNHSRRLKYTLLMACLPIEALLFVPKSLWFAASPLNTSWDVADASIIIDVALYLPALSIALWSIPIMFIVVSVGKRSVARLERDGPPVLTGKSSSSSEFSSALFASLRASAAGLALILIFILSKQVFLILCTLRYVVIEKFRRHPIVYLRSFSHDGASRSFSNAVAPALAPFGILTGLVHSRQRSSVLMETASIWQFGLMEVVPDEIWREWVEKKFRSAELVVIDTSLTTESVAWELSRALHYLAPERILIISCNEVPANVSGKVQVVRYSANAKSESSLKAEIMRWAEANGRMTNRKIIFRSIIFWVGATLLAAVEFFLVISSLIPVLPH